MSRATYVPTFRIPVDASPADAAWIESNNDGEPCELIEITDLCASCKCRAELYSPATGERVGAVDADGSYTLAGGAS